MSNILPISEIFVSPNGEGLTTGLMTLFVRVGGCNLAIDGHPCSYCDTPYAWKHSTEDILPTVEQLGKLVDKLMMIERLKEICLTGGEPLLYTAQLHELIDHLGRKYHLVVETNGTLPIWSSNAMWSMDLKTPTSGNSEYNNYDNIRFLGYKDQLKFIIGNKDDFDFALNIVKTRAPLTNIIFQPSFGLLSHAQLIEWVKQDKEIQSKIRIGTQSHKVWYPEKKRGV